MLKLKELALIKKREQLKDLPKGKLLVNTINAHSFNVAQEDADFAESLTKCDILIPDGVGIVLGIKMLTGERIQRIAGGDLFDHCMDELNKSGGKCFFLGSSNETLEKIKVKAKTEHPNIEIYTYSPPYKARFSEEDNQLMIEAINNVRPDLLWVGMTAPKQEKWAYQNLSLLEVNGVIGCIGAVFDFYAGTVKRAPSIFMKLGLEWLYRLTAEPKRLWKRYIIGNIKFLHNLK